MKPSRLSFIVYGPNGQPLYFEIKRRLFRFLFYILPTLALISLIAIFFIVIYFKQIQHMVKTREPKIISELNVQKKELEGKLAGLEAQVQNLTNKLATGVDTSKNALSSLNLFKLSAGRQDLTKSPQVSVEEVDLIPIENNLELNFKIINLTQDQKKISGYLFIFMSSGDQINVWPSNVFADKEMQIEYNKGELFATSRFRPVQALFPLPASHTALFKILIFNRTGDLVLRQVFSREVKR